MIKLDRAGRARRDAGRSAATSCREPEEDAYYVFQLVGLAVEEEGGRALGAVADVAQRARRTTRSSSTRGLLLPLVDACVLDVDLDAGRVLVARGFADAE